MESPRSAKRRKLDNNAPESPLQQRSTGKKVNGALNSVKRNTTGLGNQVKAPRTLDPISKRPPEIDIYDDIDGALPQTPSKKTSGTAGGAHLNATPQNKLSRPDLPGSASKSKTAQTPSGVNGLLKRINARLAEKQGATNRDFSADTAATTEDDGSDTETGSAGTGDLEPRKSSRAKRTSRKFLEAFEDEQLQRAAKRGAKKKTVEDQMKDIQAQSRKQANQEVEAPNASPRSAGRPVKAAPPINVSQKKAEVVVKDGVFEDAPAKKVSKKKSSTKADAAVEDEVVADDVVCKVCRKPNSPAINMIVLCDGCDNAYHQRCHKPPISRAVLNDSDSQWFCADCIVSKAALRQDQDDMPTSGKLRKTPKQTRVPREVTRTASPLDTEMVDQDQAATPSRAAKKPQPRADMVSNKPAPIRPRELSPMVLDIPENEISRVTPRGTSPVSRIEDNVPKPKLSNASADLSIPISDLQALQQTVLLQLQRRQQSRLVGLDEEHAKIANLIEQTISAGESNSMLIIGARGSGKSAIVEAILRDQTTKQSDAFHAVRLNGFIHTDDKIALREIWRQLGREMEIEDEGTKNYADTMTTLLALLSHPSELGQETDRITKSVIFVLDEFDLFATHPRQTLLYNLFDIAQSRKAPIAVLGLTTRFDVAEALEKRVKSRFSHRHVHLSLAKNLSVFREMCQSSILPAFTQESKCTEEGQKVWKAIVTDLFEDEAFNTHIRKLYYITKSVPAFNTSMLMAMSTLPTASVTAPVPASLLLSHLRTPSSASLLAPPDSKLALLTTLSTLQLALLISAARLTIIHSTDSVTFALVYEEYKSLASRARIQASAAGAIASGSGIGRVWGKEVARGAWEGLSQLELVMAEGRGELCRVDLALEEIGLAGVELGGVMTKWCREI
ncbi:hypothetical protein MBLNU459_g2553t1 [Dothideomycetes sp. NU459]